MSQGQDMLEVARSAAMLARKAGAHEAAAMASRSREVSVDWRDGKVEKLADTTTRGLSLELYVDGRYAAVSTKDLRPEALQRFIEDAVALTRTLEQDPFRTLPDPRLYEGQAAVDLQLDDPALGGVTAVRRRDLAQAAEAAARQVKGAAAIVSVTTGFGDALTDSWRVHTNGFEGTRRATSFSVSAEVSVKDADGRRPEDWDAATTRHLAALPAAEAVGRRAAERALGRLGARKGTSATMTLVIDPRAAGTLVSHLLRPLSGMALQQRQSCFDGKVGAAIGAPLLDVADDPLLPRALGSRLFDGEGLAARRFPIFERGVLRTFYVDTYYGKKLKVAPSTGRPSNLAWGLGTRDRDALVAAAGEGLLVTGFIGGNSNATTGDFSLGLNGYRIVGGRVAEPVSEMNVSGNHLELWKRLVAVGNDPYPYSPLRSPTLVLEGVSVAGT
jgi:PmbA protein